MALPHAGDRHLADRGGGLRLMTAAPAPLSLAIAIPSRSGTARQPLDLPQLGRVEPHVAQQLNQRHVELQRDAHQQQQRRILEAAFEAGQILPIDVSHRRERDLAVAGGDAPPADLLADLPNRPDLHRPSMPIRTVMGEWKRLGWAWAAPAADRRGQGHGGGGATGHEKKLERKRG